MRWKGGEEEVTGALAIAMIVAALLVVGSYALEIAHHVAHSGWPRRGSGRFLPTLPRQFLPPLRAMPVISAESRGLRRGTLLA